MTTQGGTKNRVLQQIKKAMLRHPGPFKKYPSDYNTIISLITENWYRSYFPLFILPIKLLMIYVYHYLFACPLDTNGSVASNSILNTCLQSTKKSYKKTLFSTLTAVFCYAVYYLWAFERVGYCCNSSLWHKYFPNFSSRWSVYNYKQEVLTLGQHRTSGNPMGSFWFHTQWD